ncbi:sporulation protein YqfC [Gottschalkia acidurici 9a]|uniref:Sporulation protein YqfC n=1 Tax=Gottschalkia acidurici (strain ATCC 7906 / DSM 604 / BCRC 14475 / CIP 104303 / KCTC 5404 / NCIMB 10678 / 9a) TaxID=1128398 RepID=K0B2I5_GOTA9|nr:sporulation protein YqfC [Gottschalkia acidurici]AFS78826.1 sporulation protein YqfC [Gottschalkia acidurici 9a]
MKNKADSIKNTVSEVLELPKDIMLNLPKITMVGRIQLYIENHKGIIEYSTERIRVNTSEGILKITGKNMIIKNIVTEEMVISGDIEIVEFS